jgi:hypothetical protein
MPWNNVTVPVKGLYVRLRRCSSERCCCLHDSSCPTPSKYGLQILDSKRNCTFTAFVCDCVWLRTSILLHLLRLLLLLCGAGGYPPNVLQLTEAYCTNPALGSLFISRGAPHHTTWEASISERRNYGREMSDQILPTIATSTVIVRFFYMP